jgi:hypothetical protein
MKYRKLRIAWSVTWGIACLLLVILWVRSFAYYEAVYLSSHVSIESLTGSCIFSDRVQPISPFRRFVHHDTSDLDLDGVHEILK